jgi:hypothetical protein
MERSRADSLSMSFPISSADFTAAHMVKWVLYSSSVMPSLPTSRASRSFHACGMPLST